MEPTGPLIGGKGSVATTKMTQNCRDQFSWNGGAEGDGQIYCYQKELFWEQEFQVKGQMKGTAFQQSKRPVWECTAMVKAQHEVPPFTDV